VSPKNIFNIFGLRFHSLSMQQTLEQVEKFIRNYSVPKMIFTPTAELIVRANEDEILRNIYNSSDLLTVDSYVVYYAARLLGHNIPEPVSAARLMLNLLPIIHKKGYSIYLLGATEEIVNKVVENLKKQYPNINIVGWHNGYFDLENDIEIVDDIRKNKPDILFVAMSSPLKERFISKNLNKMNVPVSIGVGGTFDIIARKCNLAPKWVSKIGLEWFYRLCQEPKRLYKRYLITNTKFLYIFIKEFFLERILKWKSIKNFMEEKKF